ncbi:MAG: hypothetical protein JSR36_13920 [Proteobacteria bacterium]|nr:hypothetical protein [Pseudomonadota bacterium]
MEAQSPGRYYSPWQVLVATIIGGPMAGGFFIAGDYSAFGAAGRGRAALIVSCLVIVAGVLLQGNLTAQMDPEDASIVAGLIAGLYGVFARAAFTAEIGRRRGAGWTQHDWARVIGISMGFLVATLLLVALAASGLAKR